MCAPNEATGTDIAGAEDGMSCDTVIPVMCDRLAQASGMTAQDVRADYDRAVASSGERSRAKRALDGLHSCHMLHHYTSYEGLDAPVHANDRVPVASAQAGHAALWRIRDAARCPACKRFITDAGTGCVNCPVTTDTSAIAGRDLAAGRWWRTYHDARTQIYDDMLTGICTPDATLTALRTAYTNGGGWDAEHGMRKAAMLTLVGKPSYPTFAAYVADHPEGADFAWHLDTLDGHIPAHRVIPGTDDTLDHMPGGYLLARHHDRDGAHAIAVYTGNDGDIWVERPVATADVAHLYLDELALLAPMTIAELVDEMGFRQP